MDPLTRRSRFILCVAVGLGLGVTIVPNWATNNLWDVYPTTGSGLAGFRSLLLFYLPIVNAVTPCQHVLPLIASEHWSCW